jgi:chemotaxis protein MotB
MRRTRRPFAWGDANDDAYVGVFARRRALDLGRAIHALAAGLQPTRGMKTNLACVFGLLAMAATGCVSQGRYDEAIAQTELTRADLHRAKSALENTRSALDKSKLDLEKNQTEMANLQARIDELTNASADERHKSARSIDDLKKSLEELRAQRSASEARAALFRSLAVRLKEQIDAGDLQIVLRDGRMVLQLPNDVLFDTGRTEIKTAGQGALKAIAAVLKTLPDRSFQVAGHTDNVPIHNDRFPSNWELSSGRALRVTHFLMGQGVTPGTLSAAGYADVDPVGSNDNAEGRRRNRRTEITLQPNINELVRVP